MFFYDLAQLEFDILSAYLPDRSSDDWHDWLNLLTFIGGDALVPEEEPGGERAPHAWELIKPIRHFVNHYVAQTRAQSSGGVAVQLERAWWLAVLTVGLRAAQRGKAEPGVRSAGLVCAGLALRHLPHEPSPDPNAVALLQWYPDHGLMTSRPEHEEPPPTSKPPESQSARLHTPHRYEIKTTFVGRAHELEALDRWTQSDKRVLEVVAIGGQGKSALTWHWFHNRAEKAIPNFAGGMWWSFYESNGAMSRCVDTALHLLGRIPPAAVAKMNRDEREDALVKLCREQPVLLVFDGMERLLNAYRTWRAATQTDEEVDTQPGGADAGGPDRPRTCFNPQDGALLRRLAEAGAARILISSRLAVADLEDQQGKTLPGVELLDLKGLSDHDVLGLFRDYGVTGSSWQMVEFARSFESHGLLLALIIGKILSYPYARRDFDRWYADDGQHLRLSSLDLAEKRNHILRFAVEGLSPGAGALLRRLAVFNYPFDFDAALAINPFADREYVRPPGLSTPPLTADEAARKEQAKEDAHRAWLYAPSGSPEEADAAFRRDALDRELAPHHAWQAEFGAREQAARRQALHASEGAVYEALCELEDRGLITYDFVGRSWDIHPVVRGYAHNELADDPNGRSEALAGKQNYFESRETKPPEKLNDLDDLRPEMEIYDALLQAGQLDRASEFYLVHLSRTLLFQFSAYHEIVRLLTPLFRKGFAEYPELTGHSAQSARITDLAIAYMHLDSEQAMRLYALAIRRDLADRAAVGLLANIGNVSLALFGQNRCGSAIHAVQLMLRLAQAAANPHSTALAQLFLFSCYCAIGWWDDAEVAASAVHVADIVDDLRVFREVELKHSAADMRIARGQDADDLLTEAERLARKSRHARNLRVTESLRGEAALLRGDGTAAAGHFASVLESLQDARLDVVDARGGLARALLLKGDRDGARAQIDAGSDNLSGAEVMLALGDNARAEKAALAAYEGLWGEGAPYAHRDLPRAEAVLTALHVAVPALPLFDEAKLQRLPEEDGIIEFITELESKNAMKAKKTKNGPTTHRG